ncbi:MAG: Uma2 family endonuclease [Cyclobacteriaceae bacterium]
MKIVSNINELDLSKAYSYADYLNWRFQERVELIRGKIFKMSPAPSRIHQQVSIALSSMVWHHFKNQRCEVFEAPFDVRLNRTKQSDKKSITVVQPDLCVICDPDKIDERGCNGAPDLVVEILSPGNSKKEMKEKFEVYEETGVREYWLVNPLDKNVIIYTLSHNGLYQGQKPVLEDENLTSYIFPEMSIPLDEVFR